MKKRSVLALALVFAFIACSDGNELNDNLGNGSTDKPFQVNSVTTLSKVGTGTDGWTLSAHYKQTANIDLTTVSNWTPIGSGAYSVSTFRGSYDGGGYTITNLTTSGLGLFRDVSADSIVKNIGLIDCNITGTNSDVGGVAGYNSGTIENCYVIGDVSSNRTAGGVVGNNYGVVENCYVIGDVSGNNYVGGVVGYNSGTMTDTYATGNVSGYSYVGGVVGYINSGTVENSYATGDVSADSEYVGGVAGYISLGTVKDCYATGDIRGNSYVGGVVGLSWNGTVLNSYATGNVSGTDRVGGVVGSNAGGTVNNCVALNGIVTRSSDTRTNFGRMGCSNTASERSTNSFARNDMVFIDENNNSSTIFPISAYNTNDHGTGITPTEWSSSNWWTGTAGWSSTIWNFSSISATSYPQLRNMP